MTEIKTIYGNDLIDREAVLFGIRQQLAFQKEKAELTTIDADKMSHSLVAMGIQLAIDIIDNAEKTDEWTPVSEGLPNRNGVYNVTRKLKEGETIYFISDTSYFDGQNTWHSDNRVNHGRPYLTDVIAWQSLPEPYKQETE